MFVCKNILHVTVCSVTSNNCYSENKKMYKTNVFTPNFMIK